MRKPKHLNVAVWIATAFTLGLNLAHSATINFDSFRNQSNQQNLSTKKQIENAINAAGNGGTVNFGVGEYTIDGFVAVQKAVNLIGRGKNSTTIKQVNTKPVFLMSSNNVSVRNMKILSDSGVSTGITTRGKSNIQITDCIIENFQNGVDNFFGQPINGLVVDGVEFLKIKWYGIWTISSSNRGAAGRAKRDMGYFRFDDNTVRIANWSQRQPLMGINIDYGNEREPGDIWTPKHYRSDGGRSLIRRNNLRECKEFNIAIARAEGIYVEGNLCVGAIANGFNASFHVEDRSNDILAQWNRFYNNKTDRNSHSVNVAGSNLNDRSERIVIRKNWIRSRSGTNALQVNDTHQSKIIGNTFEGERAGIWDIWIRNQSGGHTQLEISGNRATNNPGLRVGFQ